MVFGTAASPVLMGVLIDGGVTMEAMAWGGVAWVTLAAVLAWASGVGKSTRPPAPGV
ncbi:MAG: MFS transporter, partial [Gemmatimonadetes bacterium]|nr:MFS transporter [Gemmatimonadota bacterium]